MLYTYTDLQKFFSLQAQTLLSSSGNYDAYATQTEKLIAEKCGVYETAQDWMLMPYVWITEYLASNRYVNVSPEKSAQYKSNYDQAMKILSSHRAQTTSATNTARVGHMEGMYE